MTTVPYKTKLIETSLPLAIISTAAANEKSIRAGNPSAMHLYWSRKPVGAARAILFASLVDDPSAHPENFPDKESQDKERQRLFKIIGELVAWKNFNNSKILDKAHAEIKKSLGENLPAFLDPFAGGGALPLAAAQLGLRANASDLNPVAVLINKAMIELPPQFSGQKPCNPAAAVISNDTNWDGTRGLIADFNYYGKRLLEQAHQQIGHWYPPLIKDGKSYEPTAWLYTRTVTCPNPACAVKVPLAASFVLSEKKGSAAYIHPTLTNKTYSYEVIAGNEVIPGNGAPESAKSGRGKFNCLACGQPIPINYIKAEGQQGRLGSEMTATVAQIKGGKLFFSPDAMQKAAADCPIPQDTISGNTPDTSQGVQVHSWGFTTWAELFTPRQLTALTTFSALIASVQEEIIKDGGSSAYAAALAVYLALAVNKMADRNSAFTSWNNKWLKVRNTFPRQALPITWDYGETNPFAAGGGSWENSLDVISKCLQFLPADPACPGKATQADATRLPAEHNLVISADPPYYDNIIYADISDFFYVWLRRSLKKVYPRLFSTLLTPKTAELVACTHRYDGENPRQQARYFFENGMAAALKSIAGAARADLPLTIYYAYKQKETDADGNTASTGWETMLTAVINAGLMLTATWPIKSEGRTRMNSQKTNALTTSVVLVCRPRAADAQAATLRDFGDALKAELPPAVELLQKSNLAPVDLAQAAIGPGMQIYSRYNGVYTAAGDKITIRRALELINQELDRYLSNSNGNMDNASLTAINIYRQCGWNQLPFGDAEVLARSKNISVEKLSSMNIVTAAQGKVGLRDRTAIPTLQAPVNCLWLITQKVAAAFGEQGGGITAAAAVLNKKSSSISQTAVKNCAYSLYQIAESKGWQVDASVYNNLVVNFAEVIRKAQELNQKQPEVKQNNLEF